MSVRNGLCCALGLGLMVMVACAAGCGTVREYDYFSEVKGGGATTNQEMDIAKLMQQMRVANLRLVDSLTYMNAQGVMDNSVRMYELARSLERTQPAVALQSPDDAGKYKKIADELADIIVEVGRAAQANRFDYADANYTQAFPLCNRCHLQFRVVLEPKPLGISELEPSEPMTPATPKTEETPSATEPAPEAPKLEAAPQ